MVRKEPRSFKATVTEERDVPLGAYCCDLHVLEADRAEAEHGFPAHSTETERSRLQATYV